MSIKPTTRLGYRHSIRPHKWRLKELLDNRDQTNVEKFIRPRAPRRMAGTIINAELGRLLMSNVSILKLFIYLY